MHRIRTELPFIPRHASVFIGLTLAAYFQSVVAQDLPPKDELARNIQIEHITYTIGGFDNVLVVKAKLKNHGAIPLKDFLFACVTVSQSGTVLGTPKHTLYQSLAAGQSKTFSGVNIGFVNSQTARAGCDVISAAKKS